jgi:hypothetical protein
MLYHYVQFFYPGVIITEVSSKRVANRTDKIEVPKNSFGYRFYDVEIQECNGEKLRGKDKNESHCYYVGRAMTLADVKREMPNETILIDNMERNDFKRIVRTKYGQSIPMDDNDVIISG